MNIKNFKRILHENIVRSPIMDLSRPCAGLQDPSKNPRCLPTMASRDKQDKMEQSIINSNNHPLSDIYAIKCSDLIFFGCDIFNAQFNSLKFEIYLLFLKNVQSTDRVCTYKVNFN